MSGIVGSRFNHKGSGPVGSLGTDGQVFTSSGAGAGAVYEDAAGGAWTFLNKTTIDDDATVDIETSIDSTYPLYVLMLKNIRPATDGAKLYARVKVSSYQTSSYDYGTQNARAGAGDGMEAYNNSVSGTYFPLITSDEQGNLETEAYNGYLYLPDPSNTTNQKICWFHGTCGGGGAENHRHEGFGGYDGDAGAVTGIQFYYHSGNVTSGAISLYGITDS